MKGDHRWRTTAAPSIIGMHLLWRLFYAAVGSRWLLAAIATLARLTNRHRPGALITLLESRIGESWPRRVPGWTNVHISAALWRLRRRHRRRALTPKQAPRACPARVRIGVLGRFSGALGFPEMLFAAFPDDAELAIVDMFYQGRYAENLRRVAGTYTPVDLTNERTYEEGVERAASVINRLDLDLLLTVGYKADMFDILDRVDTPCIVHFCSGSDVLHHPKVDRQIYCQPEADYFPVGDTLFCGVTRAPVQHVRVHPGWLFFDPRDLDVHEIRPSWAARRSLIVFHGSLHKLASDSFLACMFDLLAADSTLEFVFMGKDDGRSLRMIDARARARGLQERMHYHGAFSAMRDGDGRIDDPGWQKAVTLLRQARLAPDPWPIGGGSARFEAYVLGAPTVHLALRTDAASWGRPQDTLVDLPNLFVQQATARSRTEYAQLCARCLYDEKFADSVIAAQRLKARDACDARAFWSEVRAVYDEWRTRRGRRTE